MYTFECAMTLPPGQWQTWFSEWSRARVRMLLRSPQLMERKTPRLRWIGPKHALIGILMEKFAQDHPMAQVVRDHKFGKWEETLLPFVCAVRVPKDPFVHQLSDIYQSAFEMGLQLELQAPGQLAVRGDTSLASTWSQIYMERIIP